MLKFVVEKVSTFSGASEVSTVTVAIACKVTHRMQQHARDNASPWPLISDLIASATEQAFPFYRMPFKESAAQANWLISTGDFHRISTRRGIMRACCTQSP